MIDVSLPLELDDGRPATFVSNDAWDDIVRVTFEGPADRAGNVFDETFGFYYNKKTGVFDGSNAQKHYVLRNVDTPPIIEDWRL